MQHIGHICHITMTIKVSQKKQVCNEKAKEGFIQKKYGQEKISENKSFLDLTGHSQISSKEKEVSQLLN